MAEIEQHRAAFQRALRPATDRFSPHMAIDVVRRVLPRNGILAFDVGAHTHQIASQWTAHAPATFLITNGWSSMGFGLPAAIAAKIARPDLPVVCVIGDGCFQMTCGELTVARREGLALPVVVLDDRWLSLIKVKQERRDYPHYGTTTLPPTDLAPPAHYFGVPAVGVRDASSLERELRAALAADGPTVIEAVVDPAHYSADRVRLSVRACGASEASLALRWEAQPPRPSSFFGRNWSRPLPLPHVVNLDRRAAPTATTTTQIAPLRRATSRPQSQPRLPARPTAASWGHALPGRRSGDCAPAGMSDRSALRLLRACRA